MFRINIKIILENTDIGIGGFQIPRNDSHITIDENTNIEELKLSINNDLNDLIKYFGKFMNVEEIISEQLIEIKLLEERIVKHTELLKKETDNQSWRYFSTKNTIELYTNQINLIKNWIKNVEK